MALRKLERINCGGKWPVSIKYQNLHSFKEGLILLCQSILETRRITHLHGSVHFTISLRMLNRASTMLYKVREYVSTNTIKFNYYTIFDSPLNYGILVGSHEYD